MCRDGLYHYITRTDRILLRTGPSTTIPLGDFVSSFLRWFTRNRSLIQVYRVREEQPYGKGDLFP